MKHHVPQTFHVIFLEELRRMRNLNRARAYTQGDERMKDRISAKNCLLFPAPQIKMIRTEVYKEKGD